MDFTHFTLDNGLPVYLSDRLEGTVAANLAIEFGSQREEEHELGLAHLLEHVLFGGGSVSLAADERKSFRRRIGINNAVTMSHLVMFYGGTRQVNLAPFLSYMAESGFAPSLDEEIVEREKPIILQEYRDNQSVHASDMHQLKQIVFGDNPEIRHPLGDMQIVQSATREDLLGFHRRGFSPSNASLFIAGNLPSDIDTLVQDLFGGYEDFAVEPYNYLSSSPRSSPVEVFHPAPEFGSSTDGSAAITLYCPWEYGRGVNEIPQMLLAFVVRNRLMDELRDEMRLVYNAGGGIHFENFQSALNFTVGVAPHAAKKAIDAVFDIFDSVKQDGCSIDELEDVRQPYLFQLEKNLESNISRVDSLSRIFIAGFTPDDDVEYALNVTPEDIQDAARQILPSHRGEGNYVLHNRSPAVRTPLVKEY